MEPSSADCFSAKRKCIVTQYDKRYPLKSHLGIPLKKTKLYGNKELLDYFLLSTTINGGSV